MSGLPQRRGRLTLLEERPLARTCPDPALARLLGARRLGLLFQPIVARVPGEPFDGWRVVGAEALVRAWVGDAPELRPAALLPLVARAGLMRSLLDFALLEALAATREWRAAGCELELAVNLHVGALLDDEFPEVLAVALECAGFAPERLTLEITEGEPIAELRRAAANLARLRALGVRAALDDFGAGFSNTTRLAWLPCDELKIDRSLVQGLGSGDEPRCLVEHLVGLAHAHGMTACAEGVESPAALALLAESGCDRAQGFLVGRPQHAHVLPALAAEWAAHPFGPAAPPATRVAARVATLATAAAPHAAAPPVTSTAPPGEKRTARHATR